MKTQTLRKLSTVLLLTFALFFLQSARTADIQIEIQVSPNVLNLLSKSEVVTVHTDIAYGAVVGATVTLNGVPINWWKSDDQGNFVAKFMSGDVKGLPLNLGGYNTLVLTGTTTGGGTFTGSDEIKVVSIFPKK